MGKRTQLIDEIKKTTIFTIQQTVSEMQLLRFIYFLNHEGRPVGAFLTSLICD